jgi:hypothetical protein
VRSAAYLNWRYVQNPSVRYQILVGEREGQLVGHAVLSCRDLAKDGTIALAEFLIAPGDGEAGLALLAEAESCTRQLGGVQLQCWMVSHHTFYTGLLRRSGFVYWPVRPVPRGLRHTVPFIIRLPPYSDLSPDPARLDNWFLTMGDQDYY